MMKDLTQYLPFLIPVAILEVGLMLTALIHLIKHKVTRNLNVGIWAVIIIVLEIIGPVLYFTVGRKDD
jgi:hypothetical protein